MTKDDVLGFRRRIVESNPSELICVYFDMYFAFEEDVLSSLREKDLPTYRQSLRKCSEIANHLASVLDFKYPIARDIYPLYVVTMRHLAKATYSMDAADIQAAGYIMGELQDAFREASKADDRPPMTTNVQSVTAGLTYGKGQLTEAVAADEQRRGFWA